MLFKLITFHHQVQSKLLQSPTSVSGNPSPRISGGTEAKVGEFPYQVSVKSLALDKQLYSIKQTDGKVSY
jgi:secreted trypsin-like serine protease